MSKLKIYTFPDLILAQKAKPIQRVESSMFKLADDMLETMYSSPGIGLAANQVGILDQIIVLDTEYDYDDSLDGNGVIYNKKPKILINPRIIYSEGSTIFEEGCLSVPEYHADVKRFEKIKVEYKDLNNLTQILSADGLLAIAIQHEIDHLNGKLFIDRISSTKREIVKKQLKSDRALRESGSLEDFLRPHKKKRKGM